MGTCRYWPVRRLAAAAIVVFGLLAGLPLAANPGGHSGGRSGHGATAGNTHAAPHPGNPAAAGGFHRSPSPGHGWQGTRGTGWSGVPSWGWYQPGWSLGLSAGYYAPWWWEAPADSYQLTPVESMSPEGAPPPVSYRFFCPSSSAYYPDVPTCAVPWLRVVDER